MSDLFENSSFYNTYERKCIEVPEQYKEFVDNMNVYYARGNLMGIKMSSISLLENGIWLNRVEDDLIDSDGTVNIPYGINHIRSYCMEKNNKIKKIIFPETLKDMSRNSVVNLYSLREVEFNYGIKSIERETFWQCPIEKLTLSGSIEHIKYGSFVAPNLKTLKLNYGTKSCELACPSLEELWIPPTITSFVSNAPSYMKYYDFSNLRDIYVFKGARGVITTIPKSLPKNVRIHEVEDGWGNWRENEIIRLNSLKSNYLSKIEKTKRRIEKLKNHVYEDNYTIKSFNENIEKYEVLIKHIDKKIEVMQEKKYT